MTKDGGRATGGIYLAPWLLDSEVLALTHDKALPLVTVASIADPMSPLADRYRAALAVLVERGAPTAAGLLGFLSIASPAQSTSLRLYAAAPVGFLPGVLNVGHDHGSAGWFPNGTLAPITAAQPVRTSCATTS
jgi:hypothetical protein